LEFTFNMTHDKSLFINLQQPANQVQFKMAGVYPHEQVYDANWSAIYDGVILIPGMKGLNRSKRNERNQSQPHK